MSLTKVHEARQYLTDCSWSKVGTANQTLAEELTWPPSAPHGPRFAMRRLRSARATGGSYTNCRDTAKRGLLTRKSRHLWPSCAVFANKPALELVLSDAIRHIAGPTGDCMTTLPASDLDVGDVRREQFIGDGGHLGLL